MTARLVNLSVRTYAQIKCTAVLNQRFMQSRKKYVPLVCEICDGDHQKSVILSGVAAHDCGIYVPSGTVGQQYLPVEGILKVNQFFLVKFQICHFVNF